MRINRLTPKAQTIVELIAIFALVAVVLIAAGIYYRRTIQARYRQAADVLGGGEQYTVK